MAINRRMIRNWWRSLKTKPVSPRLERVNILFTIGLTLVSTFIALITFRQQQEIKGMSNLLFKQDTLITQLTKLVTQNEKMISKIDTTQLYLIDNLSAIKLQTESSSYSSRPILDQMGFLTLKLPTSTIPQSKVVLSIKNYGYRPATKIRVKGAWQVFRNGTISNWLTIQQFEQQEPLPPGQALTLTISIDKEFTQESLLEFQTLFLALDVEYFDPLTKKTETKIIYKKQSKDYTAGFNLRISLNNVSEEELHLLKKYRTK
jgi:hypothetical protein